MHHKCTGVYRFVRGVPVGIGRRVADLWGFCGTRKRLLTYPATGTCGQVLQPLGDGDRSRITQSYRAACRPVGNTAPNADYFLGAHAPDALMPARRMPCAGSLSLTELI